LTSKVIDEYETISQSLAVEEAQLYISGSSSTYSSCRCIWASHPRRPARAAADAQLQQAQRRLAAWLFMRRSLRLLKPALSHGLLKLLLLFVS